MIDAVIARELDWRLLALSAGLWVFYEIVKHCSDCAKVKELGRETNFYFYVHTK
jgi:hypothetical protein